MKILVKGNIIGLGYICTMQTPIDDYFVFVKDEPKESDYDIIIRGDIEVDSIFFGNFVEPIYCTGAVITYGMDSKAIDNYKNKINKVKKGE